MLKEAETQFVMVPRKYEDTTKQQTKDSKLAKQKEYLPKRVISTEVKKAFVYEHRKEYCGGDFDKILSEAEKSRLIYIILDKIKLTQMPSFMKAMMDSK